MADNRDRDELGRMERAPRDEDQGVVLGFAVRHLLDEQAARVIVVRHLNFDGVHAVDGRSEVPEVTSRWPPLSLAIGVPDALTRCAQLLWRMHPHFPRSLVSQENPGHRVSGPGAPKERARSQERSKHFPQSERCRPTERIGAREPVRAPELKVTGRIVSNPCQARWCSSSVFGRAGA